jgi:hypothetical protein
MSMINDNYVMCHSAGHFTFTVGKNFKKHTGMLAVHYRAWDLNILGRKVTIASFAVPSRCDVGILQLH